MLTRLSLIIAALLAATGIYAQESMKVEMSAIPEDVMSTVKKEVPGFTAKSATSEVENGQKVYEIQGSANGKQVEVDVLEDGTLDEVETEVTMKELPQAVSKAIMAKMSAFKASKIEQSRRPDGTYYEVEGSEGGKQYDIEIMADGTGMEVEELTKAS